jgi:hypothetical protein
MTVYEALSLRITFSMLVEVWEYEKGVSTGSKDRRVVVLLSFHKKK